MTAAGLVAGARGRAALGGAAASEFRDRAVSTESAERGAEVGSSPTEGGVLHAHTAADPLARGGTVMLGGGVLQFHRATRAFTSGSALQDASGAAAAAGLKMVGGGVLHAQ